MLTVCAENIRPDLQEVVNLFEGADELDISHAAEYKGKIFLNTVTIDGAKYEYKDVADYSTPLEEKRYFKRFAKLSMYRALCDHLRVSMPWGALTGIRPVKLAYQQGEGFEKFFEETMLVSREKTEIVKQIVEAQKGIYELDPDNGDFFAGIPFCPTRCSYCSFVSSEISKTKYLEEYVDALVKEIAASKPLIRKLRSIYIGGGTPVSLPKPLLMRVLGGIGKNTDGVEYTVEAGRPDCIDAEVLQILKDYGVTRICVNPQTFNDKTLNLLGRKHTAQDVIDKFKLAEEFGFDINMDLIAGLPEESFNDFKHSVDTAVSLRPANVTIHTLCLKKGSKLKESTSRLSVGEVAEMIDYSHDALMSYGYSPYYLYRQKYMAGNLENTGYTLPGKACVYNVDIMEEIAQNVACGANAVSKHVSYGEKHIERYGAPKDVKTYVEKIDTIIAEKQKMFGRGMAE